MAVTKAVLAQGEDVTAEMKNLTEKFNLELTTIKDQAQHYTNMCVELAQKGLVIAKRADDNKKAMDAQFERLLGAVQAMRQAVVPIQRALDKEIARASTPAKRPTQKRTTKA